MILFTLMSLLTLTSLVSFLQLYGIVVEQDNTICPLKVDGGFALKCAAFTAFFMIVGALISFWQLRKVLTKSKEMNRDKIERMFEREGESISIEAKNAKMSGREELLPEEMSSRRIKREISDDRLSSSPALPADPESELVLV